jgi:hypothetical protein
VRLRILESGYADRQKARVKWRGTSIAIRLNQQAVEHAQNLIKGRQYEKDSDWSEAQPSAEEENKFIDENDWGPSRNGTWRTTPKRAKRPSVAISSPMEISTSYIAAPSSPPNSAPAQKTTTHHRTQRPRRTVGASGAARSPDRLAQPQSVPEPCGARSLAHGTARRWDLGALRGPRQLQGRKRLTRS